jgi:hypothetical protein
VVLRRRAERRAAGPRHRGLAHRHRRRKAVGISFEATAARHRRPGVVYRPVRDAPPVPVWLAWWTDSPPPNLDALLQLICQQYAQRPPRGRR